MNFLKEEIENNELIYQDWEQKNTTWKSGIWYYNNWYDSIREDDKWYGGTWKNKTWYNGQWIDEI